MISPIEPMVMGIDIEALIEKFLDGGWDGERGEK